MTVYDALPYVERCCFCCGLKCGSALIAILGILRVGLSVATIFLPLCGSSDGTMALIMKYLGYAMTAVDGILCIFSFVFLIGLCIDRYVTAIMLLHAMALFIIANIVYFIASIVAMILDSNCQKFYPIPGFFVSIILWIYFMIIIRSYKDGMA